METTQTKDPWKDKYGYDIPRCRYISLIGEQCNAAPITGDHFCPKHDPAEQAKQREALGNLGRKFPRLKAPLVVPVGLPRVVLQTPEDAGALFVETINFVRTGEMDHRVASTIGYLAMGWLHSFEVSFRTCRQVVQDEEKAAEKAEKKQAHAAEKAAAQNEAEAEQAAEPAAEKAEPQPAEHHDRYERERRFTNYNVRHTTNGEKPPGYAGQTTALGSGMVNNGRH